MFDQPQAPVSTCKALGELALAAYQSFPPLGLDQKGYEAIDLFLREFAATPIRSPTRMRKIGGALKEGVPNYKEYLRHLADIRQGGSKDDARRYLREFAEHLFAIHEKTFADAKAAYDEAVAI